MNFSYPTGIWNAVEGKPITRILTKSLTWENRNDGSISTENV